MALEGRDINDSAILDATGYVIGPNDTLSCKITLPSGRVLTSAPFRQDQRREAILAWVGVVRENILADEEEKIAAKRAALVRKELVADLQETRQPVAPVAVNDPRKSPVEYARSMYESADLEAEKLTDHLQATEASLREAVQARTQWHSILSALTQGQEDNG